MKLRARFFFNISMVICALVGLVAMNAFSIFRITELKATEKSCDSTIHVLIKLERLTAELLSTETLDDTFADWQRSYEDLQTSIRRMNETKSIQTLISNQDKQDVMGAMNRLWGSTRHKLDKVRRSLADFLERDNPSKDGILLQYSEERSKELFFLRNDIYDASNYLATDFESRLEDLLSVVQSETRREIRSTIILGVVVSAAIIVTIFLILVPFLIRLRKHLGGMHQAMTRLGRGDFSIRLNIPGNDELSDIARVVNLTTRNLEEALEKSQVQAATLALQRQELETVNDRLGELVEERTVELKSTIGQLRDEVRERMATADALIESERRFRTLANATSANIAIVQGQRFVYANKGFEEFAEMTWERLRETPIHEVLPEEGLRQGALALERAKKDGDSKYRYELADPRTSRWYEVSAGIFEMDGEPAVISTSFDITDRKLADEQMFRAEKMAALGQVIAGVAHEINNPNNFIYFNLPILGKYIEAIRPILDAHAAATPDLKILGMPYDFFMEDITKLLENMKHGSKRITGIVSELKDHVRAEASRDVKSEQLDGVVDHVMTLIGKQVRKLVKRFDVEVADGLPPVEINAGKIEQVLINFVINAGQAADKDDSFVLLSVRPCAEDKAFIEIRIEDNGSGIPQESLHQIFEPFFTTKGRDVGTGLGLSISQRIIEDHGGSIGVESTVGEGTCFTIRLPAIAN